MKDHEQNLSGWNGLSPTDAQPLCPMLCRSTIASAVRRSRASTRNSPGTGVGRVRIKVTVTRQPMMKPAKLLCVTALLVTPFGWRMLTRTSEGGCHVLSHIIVVRIHCIETPLNAAFPPPLGRHFTITGPRQPPRNFKKEKNHHLRPSDDGAMWVWRCFATKVSEILSFSLVLPSDFAIGGSWFLGV